MVLSMKTEKEEWTTRSLGHLLIKNRTLIGRFVLKLGQYRVTVKNWFVDALTSVNPIKGLEGNGGQQTR